MSCRGEGGGESPRSQLLARVAAALQTAEGLGWEDVEGEEDLAGEVYDSQLVANGVSIAHLFAQGASCQAGAGFRLQGPPFD